MIGSRAMPWLLLATTLATTGLGALLPSLRACFASPRARALSVGIADRGREYPTSLAATAEDEGASLATPWPTSTGGVGGFAIAAVRPPAARENAPASLLVKLQQAVPLNAPVKRALDDWLTWNRPQLATAYDHYLFLRPEVAPIYEKAALPEALLFGLIAQETGGKVHAYSSAGAAGPLQFMPTTARQYGLHAVSGFDMRLDPVASTKASAAYLTALLDRFDGDLAKALAAYNMGENKLATLQRALGDVSLWDTRLSTALPDETRRYVPAVLAAAWIFAHAPDYGLVASAPETATTVITLQEPASIGELTICLGAERNPGGWFRALRNLNPRRSGRDRIAAGERVRMPSMLARVYAERCTGDSSQLALARDLYEGRQTADEESGIASQKRKAAGAPTAGDGPRVRREPGGASARGSATGRRRSARPVVRGGAKPARTASAR